MSKIFVLNPEVNPLSKEEIYKIEVDFQKTIAQTDAVRGEVNQVFLSENEDLKHPPERIIIKINTDGKNSHTFQDGTKIRIERKYNNFNRRETEAVNAIVISADNIPIGSEILIGHNALHDTNRIFNYTQTSGKAELTDVRYFSLPIDECFAWRDDKGNLNPMKNFCFGLRVFKPYKGIMEGVEPTLIPEVLFMTTGEFSGQVVHVLKASDYEIVYMGLNGREERVIRCRHYENEDNVRQEIIAVSGELTEQVMSGDLLIGLSKSDCKPFEISAYAD